MVYKDYIKFKHRYIEAQRKFDEILKEKEELFTKTLPQSPKWDKQYNFSNQVNKKFDNYICAKEAKKIDERLDEIKAILEARTALLDRKEAELLKSKEIEDVIYNMRILCKCTIKSIEKLTNFGRSKIYRTLAEISRNESRLTR